MSKNEDYLDELLNSVSGRNDRHDIEDLLDSVREDEKKLDREREKKERRKNFGEQFSSNLEQELSEREPDGDDDDFIRNFELELDEEEAGKQMNDFPEEIFGKQEPKEEMSGESLIQSIDGIVDEAKRLVDGEQPQEREEEESLLDTISLDGGAGAEDSAAPFEEEEGAQLVMDGQPSDTDEQILDENKLETGEQANATDDLLDLLSELTEDSDLSDIGAMLKADETGEEVSKEDAGEMEMLESIDELSGISDKKGKKKKKVGPFGKFLNMLFGSDEEEIQTHVAEEGTVGNISDENLGILRELDSQEQEKDPKAKKEKKKKEKKKEKKEKEEKPKKVKKAKPPKEKKPKEKDMSPPLPKKPMILIAIMSASIFLLIMLGSHFVSYSNDLSTAKEQYEKKNYVEAYEALAGRTVRESDRQFSEQCAVMAMVQSEYQSHFLLMDLKEYEMALDALIRGIGRYDKYYEKAEELDIVLEYNLLESQIEKTLEEQFGITADKARELYNMRRREDYSISLRQILEGLGLEVARGSAE